MWNEDYQWHLDYIRIAWDSGFSFEKYKSPNFDKNKFYLIDIERIIKERDLITVDKYVPTVVQYILDNDQAKILDDNFVKMFKISQLSIEYLLFCKKYLDHTVVLLKKEITQLKEENNELKVFVEELENHITTLTDKFNNLNNVVSFKCDKCLKLFSTEKFLSAHIERRHNNNENDYSDTNKLHLEIKQLKERLNSTEKLLQIQSAKQELTENKDISKENRNELEEMHEKFELFKIQVEDELKTLQMQKTFYEDKYVKLFDIASQSVVAKQVEVENTKEMMQNATQTENDLEIVDNNLKMEKVPKKNIYDFKDVSCQSSLSENNESDSEDKEVEQKFVKFEENVETNVLEQKIVKFEENVETKVLEQKIAKFEETMETKVSLGFTNIENQMQAFWSKLLEIQTISNEKNSGQNKEIDSKIKDNSEENYIKPKAKPRSKFTTASRKPKEPITVNVSSEPSPEVVKRPLQAKIMFDTSEESSSSSESIKKAPEQKKTKNKPPKSTTRTKLKTVADEKEVSENVREELEAVLKARLQEMGISPDWTGIPRRTFEKTMQIVQHQANLAKKSYKKFDAVKESIENSLMSKNLDVNKRKRNKNNLRKSAASSKKSEPVIAKNISERQDESSIITIKNRSLYDTDSDSDAEAPVRVQKLPDLDTKNVQYASVIDELKKFPAKNKNELKISDFEQKLETKSVLKSYPSMGSLSKKKVLFDIESDSNGKHIKDNNKLKDGGSTTSVASSVLDEIHKGSDSGQEKLKGYESLSDFDFSDL